MVENLGHCAQLKNLSVLYFPFPETTPKKKEQERKDDTRRKILLGSYLIKKMQSNEANKEKILAELNEYLTENRDRQLFDLPNIEISK